MVTGSANPAYPIPTEIWPKQLTAEMTKGWNDSPSYAETTQAEMTRPKRPGLVFLNPPSKKKTNVLFKNNHQNECLWFYKGNFPVLNANW